MTHPDALFQLVYASRNLIPAAQLEAEIPGLLAVAQRNNRAARITGALLVSRHAFMQVLEGPRGRVQALYRQLAMDPRHADCAILTTRDVPARRFGPMPMAYAGRDDALDFAAAQAAVTTRCGLAGSSPVLDRLRAAAVGEMPAWT